MSDCKSAHPGQAACPLGASTLPNMGKHVTHHGQARYPTWAWLLHGCCPFVPDMAKIRLGLNGIRFVFLFETKLSTPIPPRKEVLQHLQIQLNPGQNPKLISSILSKKINPWKDRSVFLCSIRVSFFLICVPAEGWGYNDDTEWQYHISDNKVSISLRRWTKI